MLVKRLLPMQKSSLCPKMLLVAFLAFLFVAFVVASPALAQTQDYGLGAVRAWGIFGESNIFVFIGRLIQIFLGLLGVVAVIIIMYAGFSIMLSQGDPAKVAKGRKILTNAIIGLIIIFMSFALVTFVISRLAGISRGTGGPGNYPGSPFDPYRSAIGRGPIESVFPAPNAIDIPINTWIAVTFKEAIDWDSVHTTSGADTLIDHIEICEIAANSNNCSSTDFMANQLASSTITMTADQKTIVITPNKWLGYEDELERTFKVKLLPGIETVAGSQIFGSGGFGYYEWAFRTNGRLDLDPPEVISTNANMLGVYPMPDDLIDTYSDYQAAVKGQATATFSGLPATNSPTLVNGEPFDKKAEVQIQVSQLYSGTIAPGFQVKAKTEGGFNPDFSGEKIVTITITDADTATFGGDYADLGLEATAVINGTTINTKVGLIIETNGVQFPPGSIWQFTATGSGFGDVFVINAGASPYRFIFVGNNDERKTIIESQTIGGDITYQTVKTGNSLSDAAFYLADAINSSYAGSAVKASSTGANVVLTATVAGNNNIGVTEDSSFITLSADNLAGGQPAQFGREKHGNQDAYNNTIFQINFNEAVNPAFVDSIKVYNNGVLVSGSTTISNQYRTIEIKGPHECGVNTCGDKRYCWLDQAEFPITSPVSILFSVEIGAASLRTCAGGDTNWCTQSFKGACEGTDSSRCSKPLGSATVYFPQAKINNIDGIIDMSGNSFNGSFNTTTDNNGRVIGISEGKSDTSVATGGSNHAAYVKSTSTYPAPSSAAGDNFKWTFYVSNEVDSYAPLLKTIDPTGDYDYGYASTEDFSRSVRLAFDRLMSYSSLKPGWGYDSDRNSKAWHNRYLALTTLTKGNTNPVGFWISNDSVDFDGDKLSDYTLAGIEHNRFDRSVRYSPLAGSGLMSLTQNCFLPSRGPANAGSGECLYDSGNPSGCTASALPNPASYAKLKCAEIDGAGACSTTLSAAKKCMPLYDDAPSTSSGSWVITDDYPTTYADNSTGCCLGRCENP